MADFFNQEELKNITLTKEHDIPNVVEFSRQNPNITLGSFKEHHELYETEVPKIDVSKLQRFENNVMPSVEESKQESIHDKLFKTQKDRAMELKRARAKLYVSMFFIVTFILTGFVIYNLVSTLILNNKISNNASKIKNINKLIDKVQDQQNQQPANYELPSDLMV